MTLTGYLALNSVYAPVWLAETARLRKIIAWKLIKIDTYVSGAICWRPVECCKMIYFTCNHRLSSTFVQLTKTVEAKVSFRPRNNLRAEPQKPEWMTPRSNSRTAGEFTWRTQNAPKLLEAGLHWGSLQRSRPLVGGTVHTQEPHPSPRTPPRLSPSGFKLRPFGPRLAPAMLIYFRRYWF